MENKLLSFVTTLGWSRITPITFKRRMIPAFLSVLALLFTTGTLAQSGMLDPSFDPGTGANSGVNGIAVQDDGRILIGGHFYQYNGVGIRNIARLQSDGTLDGTFNPGIGTNGNIYQVALQNDGKIILSGNFTTYDGTSANNIARVNSDGSLDGSFLSGIGANTQITSMGFQDDGKILIGGTFTSYNGVSRNRIARLNENGSLDMTFAPGTGASNFINAIAIQSDGKILIGGFFTAYNGVQCNRIARLNSDGSLDTSFNPGSGASGMVQSVAIQSDGKIIIMGSFTSYNGTSTNLIARLNPNGTLDGSFTPGIGLNEIVYASVVQNDDKIIIGGDFTLYNGTARNSIARLNSDGTLDISFDPGTGANIGLNCITTQSDGNILIGGWFTNYNGYSRNRIARIAVIPTSIEDLVNEERLMIHPNPLSTHTSIHTKEDFRNGTLVIYNSVGAVVARMENLSGRSITLQRNDLASGHYFVRLTTDGKCLASTPLVIVD